MKPITWILIAGVAVTAAACSGNATFRLSTLGIPEFKIWDSSTVGFRYILDFVIYLYPGPGFQCLYCTVANCERVLLGFQYTQDHNS